MNEKFVLDMLVLNGVNYHRFGDKKFEADFTYWMYQLQKVKGFETIEQACNYFGEWGASPCKQTA